MKGPDPRKRARREVVAAIVGAEAGAAVGLLFFGGVPLAPLALVALGAAAGAGAMHARHTLFRRWVRSQLRAAR
jgi:uncharacterized membrane protein